MGPDKGSCKGCLKPSRILGLELLGFWGVFKVDGFGFCCVD